jgi:6-phosphogluconolactonase/glucosamine-6-phosphate isomerase/deaminase
MTAPFINRAALALFVVSGASKAAVVKRPSKANPIPGDTCTIDQARQRPLWWLLDEEAAALLGPPR